MKIRFFGVLTSFLLLSPFVFSSLALSEANQENQGYVCKADNDCLDRLHNVLLDKENNRGVYQYCKITYESIKLCCINLLQCQEIFGKNLVQEKQAEELKKIRESITLHQMVYQSVEAPQIEPLEKQEFQKDPYNPVFTSYDLVRGKSAGVWITINKDKNKKHNVFREFELQMKIGAYQINTKCLRSHDLNPISTVFQSLMVKPDPSACFFAMDFLQDYNPPVSLFIELPMSGLLSIAKENILIRVDLVDVQSSELISSINFKVNVIETRPISIGIMGIDLKCEVKDKKTGRARIEDLSTDWSTIEKLLKSDEVRDYLPYIFPVAEPEKLEDIIGPLRVKHFHRYLLSEKVNQFLNKLKPEDMISIKGSCDKGKGVSFLYGIASLFPWVYSRGTDVMFLTLQDTVKKSSVDKIIIVASEKYMEYHGINQKIVGFVQGVPENLTEAVARLLNDSELKVGLMRESAISKVALLHELGHTFGQLKEFYESKNKCQRFNSDPSEEESCDSYEIIRGLKGKIGGPFEWVENRYGIMNSSGNIHDRWISRETFQKAFAYLKREKKGQVMSPEEQIYEMYGRRDIPLTREVMEPFLITGVHVTGYYDRKTKKFHSLKAYVGEGFSYETTPRFDPKKNNIDFSDILQDIEYIKIQLKDSQSNVLYEVKAPGSNYVELFYENQLAFLELNKVYISVQLPLYSEKGNFKVYVSKGTLSSDPTGQLKDVEDKNSIQEIQLKW